MEERERRERLCLRAVNINGDAMFSFRRHAKDKERGRGEEETEEVTATAYRGDSMGRGKRHTSKCRQENAFVVEAGVVGSVSGLGDAEVEANEREGLERQG
ncbi:hypothetical protein TRVL_08335 [Trypanosoma vivax]|nr:hypothetical protein TRVL_08335 [Trypanosoma vivax]